MKRGFIVLAIVLAMVVALSGQALAQTASHERTASFDVSTVIDMTIADAGGQGLFFGGVTFNTPKPEISQTASAPAVTVKLSDTTNVTCDLHIYGNDFASGSSSLTIGALKYKFDSEVTGFFPVASSVTGAAAMSNMTKGQDIPIYHWMQVPVGTAPGTYTTTVTYKAVQP